MELLKHSLDLQLPTCPNCGIEMQWYGSELVRFVPATNLKSVQLSDLPTICGVRDRSRVGPRADGTAARSEARGHGCVRAASRTAAPL